MCPVGIEIGIETATQGSQIRGEVAPETYRGSEACVRREEHQNNFLAIYLSYPVTELIYSYRDAERIIVKDL